MEISGMELLLFFNGLFFVLAFYFTLTFFQQLKEGDVRSIRQAKLWAAVYTTLAIATASFIMYNTMLVN